jgi:hypothetical protein
MANALDAFRAQREAAEHVHARLNEVAVLLARLRQQVDGLALHPELNATLRDEQMWLTQAQRTVEQVRQWREMESGRLWLPVLWRWVLAGAFALVSAGIAGAGYAWVMEPYAAELKWLRSEASFSAFVQRRLQTMTPAELREYERLMRIPKATTQ